MKSDLVLAMKNNIDTQTESPELSLDNQAVMAIASQFFAVEIFLERLMEVTPAPECKEQEEVMEMGKGLLAYFKNARQTAGIEMVHNIFPSKGNN
jgi:hypothetical protein